MSATHIPDRSVGLFSFVSLGASAQQVVDRLAAISGIADPNEHDLDLIDEAVRLSDAFAGDCELEVDADLEADADFEPDADDEPDAEESYQLELYGYGSGCDPNAMAVDVEGARQ